MIHGGNSQYRSDTRPHVAILLSIYNGENWLNAQLDSFLAQTWADWTLYWRDDGSSDASVAIMHSFMEHRGHGRCVEVERSGTPLGVSLSYALLTDCVPPGSILSFSDQDDVWYPEKLAWGLASLSAVEAGKPALYCARQSLTDATLTVIGQSPMLCQTPDFASSLIQNLATGHTLMLNPAAVGLLRDFPPPEGILHDWWAFMVVMGAGGAFLFDPRPVSLYRQHGRNAVGAQGSFVGRAIGALRRGPRVFISHLQTSIRTLRERPETLSGEARALLDDMAAATTVRQRLRLLRAHPELKRQTRAETLLFRIWYLGFAGRDWARA